MILNIFFGVVVNAARGVANQVNGVIQQFVSNFMMALNPQITKSYAAGDKDYSFALACRGARFSFFIMYLLALPVMLEANYILHLWLGTPPEQAAEFFVWTVISSLIMLLGNTLVTLQNAHGDIRHYQLWITFWGYFPFPLTWLAFYFGAPAVWAFIIYIIVYWILLFVRYYLVHQSTGIPAKQYLGGVILKCHIVGIVSAIIPLFIRFTMEEAFLRLVIVGIVSVAVSAAVIYFYGMERGEQQMVLKATNKAISKFHKS